MLIGRNVVLPGIVATLTLVVVFAHGDDRSPVDEGATETVTADRGVDTEIAVLLDPTASVEEKSAACRKLFDLEGRAWPATEALIDLLDDPQLKPQAERVLRRVGPMAAQALGERIAALDSRMLAETDLLASMTRGANAAVPPLCDAVVKGRSTQKVMALNALRRLGNVSRSAWPEIRAALGDDELGVRHAALRAAVAALDLDPLESDKVLNFTEKNTVEGLRQIEHCANPADAIPALIYESHSGDPAVRAAALRLWALLAVCPSAQFLAATPPRPGRITVDWPVEQPLDAETAEAIRNQVLSASDAGATIAGLGDDPMRLPSYIPFLLEAFNAPDRTVREGAVAKAIERASDVIPLLQEATQSGDPALRAGAVHATAMLAGTNDRALDLLHYLLDAPRSDVKIYAIRDVGRSGSRAEPAMKKLIALAGGGDDFTIPAIAALSDLGPAALRDDATRKACVQALWKHASNARDPVAPIASIAWARLAPGSDERQIPALLAVRRSSDPGLRTLAIDAFFGQPRSATLIAATITLLDDADNEVRLRAVNFLAGCGADARPAAARLSRMVDNQFAPLRQAAARALIRVEPGPRELAAAYVAAVRNDDVDAQATLAAAVRKSPESAKWAMTRLTGLESADSDENTRTHAGAAIDAIAH